MKEYPWIIHHGWIWPGYCKSPIIQILIVQSLSISFEFTLVANFQCIGKKNDRISPKMPKSFSSSMQWVNLNWTSCCTFVGFTQPSKVLHSDGKFINTTKYVDFSSLSSIYKSFPFKLSSSLFSSRRSLVIWFNYNCSSLPNIWEHTQINQANTDTLQLDQQKGLKLEQK